jgi:hypothetical protein
MERKERRKEKKREGGRGREEGQRKRLFLLASFLVF